MGYVLTEQERERHLARISTPEDWPMWPVCPIKRSGKNGGLETGFLVAWEGRLTTVFDGNIFELGKGTFDEVFGPLPQKQYDNHEAILDDGWVVD